MNLHHTTRGSATRDALAAVAVILSVLLVWHDLVAAPRAASRARQSAAAGGVSTSGSSAPYFFDGDLGDLPIVSGYYAADRNVGKPGSTAADAPFTRGPGSFFNVTLNVSGMSFTGPVPSQVTGDVGPAHVIQTVNGAEGVLFSVFDKSSGAVLAGPSLLKSLHQGVCALRGTRGSVHYDESTGRWFLFKVQAHEQVICLSMSNTVNPVSGGWTSYAFPTGRSIDLGGTLAFARYGVVPGAAVAATANSFSSNLKITALHTADLLAAVNTTGANVTYQQLPIFNPSHPIFFPTVPDQEGPIHPWVLDGGYIRVPLVWIDDEEARGFSLADDKVQVAELLLSETPGLSVITPATPYVIPELDIGTCLNAPCVEQPGNYSRLDGHAGGPPRLVYRRFGGNESMMMAYTVSVLDADNVSTTAYPAWLHLFRSGNASTPWTLVDYGDLSLHLGNESQRFAPGLSLDGNGNFIMAYSRGGEASFPRLQVAARNRFSTTFPVLDEPLASSAGGQLAQTDWSTSWVRDDPASKCSTWVFGTTLDATGHWRTHIFKVQLTSPFCVEAPTPPVCGNGIVEGTEECDGEDDACAGLCNVGTCECPAPTCGNDVIEVGESCDGSSDDACPAACVSAGAGDECLCPTCGDGLCDEASGENAGNCEADCACIPALCGSPDPNPAAPCYCDELCLDFGDCCSDPCGPCGICPTCGDGVLQFGEPCDDGSQCQDGTDCTDDASLCTGIGDGSCAPRGGDCCSATCEIDAPDTACTDDGNLCTDDLCGPVGDCRHPFVSAGTPCEDDHNPCTIDVCNADGVCIGGPRAGSCGGDACFAAGTCSGGECSGTPLVDCDDGEPCTDDFCDATLGCQNEPNSAPCDDGIYCNGIDRCEGGSCVVHLGNPCDADGVCMEGDQECAFATPQVTGGVTDFDGFTSAAVRFFRAGNGSLMGSVPLDIVNVTIEPGVPRDLVISPDRTSAYVTDSHNGLWFIDVLNLQTQPDTPLARLSHAGDVALSPDGRHSLVCSDDREAAITIVDNELHRVATSYPVGSSCTAVDVCADRSVLWADYHANNVRRFHLHPDGSLVDTGDQAFVPGPFNVQCAGNVAVVTTRNPGGRNYVLTFSIPGLSPIDEEEAPVDAVLATDVDPIRGRLYVRGRADVGGSLAALDYDASAGTINAFLYALNLTSAGLDELGTDQLAHLIVNDTLYVPQSGQLLTIDAETGTPDPAFFVAGDAPAATRTITGLMNPISVALTSGFGSCCTPHPALGCEDDGCQACVCAADPTCCQGGWDGACVGRANSECAASCACGPACTPGNCNAVGGIDAGDPVCSVLCLIGEPGVGADCVCAADCNCVGGLDAGDPVCTVLRLIDDFSPDTCLPVFATDGDAGFDTEVAGPARVKGGKVTTAKDGERSRVRLRLAGRGAGDVAAADVALSAHARISKVRLARRLRRAGFTMQLRQPRPEEVRLMIVPPVRAPIEAIERGPLLAVRLDDASGSLYLRRAELGSTRGLPIARAIEAP